MKQQFIALLFLTIFFNGCSLSQFTNQNLNYVERASVEILKNGQLAGSGCFVDADGTILTALHVLGKPGNTIEIIKSPRERADAKIIAVDAGHDLALLKIETADRDFLKVAKSMPPIGTKGFLYGAPQFRHEVLLQGFVARSNVTFEWYENRYNRVFHFDAMSPKGVSGGQWVDKNNRIIGLQSGMLISKGAQSGVAFVAPVDAIRRLVKIKKHAESTTLKIALEEIWEQTRYVKNFPIKTEGIIIANILDGSPISETEIEQGNLIFQVDGHPVRYREDFLKVMRQKKPGDSVRIKTMKPETHETVTATVKLQSLEKPWVDFLAEKKLK